MQRNTTARSVGKMNDRRLMGVGLPTRSRLGRILVRIAEKERARWPGDCRRKERVDILSQRRRFAFGGSDDRRETVSLVWPTCDEEVVAKSGSSKKICLPPGHCLRSTMRYIPGERQKMSQPKERTSFPRDLRKQWNQILKPGWRSRRRGRKGREAKPR
jgi:hypothetical protein